MILMTGTTEYGDQHSSEPEKQERMIERIFGSEQQGWPAHVMVGGRVFDNSSDDETDWADHLLTVGVDPQSGYGALHWFRMDGALPSITYNEDEVPEVTIVRDGGSGDPFPSSSLLPLEQVRTALFEFSRTGMRPECVRWQEFDKL